MIDEAKRLNGDLRNASFAVNERADLALLATASFDLVVQLPAKVGWRVRLHPYRLLNRALRALPVAPRWALRRVMSHSMQLSSLPEEQVRSILGACGASVAVAFSDNRMGADVVPSLTYVARLPS